MHIVPLIAANWKMHLLPSEAERWAASFAERLAEKRFQVEVAIMAPYTHLAGLSKVLSNLSAPVALGAQDVSAHEVGAYTGEVSAAMLRDLDVRYVIVGHSERRQYHQEDDALINKKVRAVLAARLAPILCVGEKLQEREAGNAEQVVLGQLEAGLAGTSPESERDLVVAYEPVWAIGTGRTASAADAEAMCALIRGSLAERYAFGSRIPILYGGSMKPENARELLGQPNVSGGLVGGASLDIESLLTLVEAADA